MATATARWYFGPRPHYKCVLVRKHMYFLMCFRLSSTLKRPKTLMKTETFENGFWRRIVSSRSTGKNGGFWKRRRKKRHKPWSLPLAFSGVLLKKTHYISGCKTLSTLENGGFIPVFIKVGVRMYRVVLDSFSPAHSKTLKSGYLTEHAQC